MSPRTVLIVDDSPVVRHMLAKRLEAEGYRCLHAGNGAEGAMEAIAHRPDAVITDLEMPVMDGFQLARLLKSDEATADMPVIVLTSHGEASSRYWSLHTGADRFITKSDDVDAVLAVLAELVGPADGGGREDGGRDPGDPPGPLEIVGRVARQLDERLLETTIAQNLLESGMAAEDLPEAVDAVLEVLDTVIDSRMLAISIAPSRERPRLFVRCRAGVAREPVLRALGGALAAAWEGADPGHVDLVELPSLRARHDHRHRHGAAAADGEAPEPVLFRLPLRQAKGVLAVVPVSAAELEGLPRRLLTNLASQIGLVLDNARLADRLRELSTLDGLTGLLNHRAILQRLHEEMDRLSRYGGEMTVVLLDLDEFKQVNDRWGHLTGDEVLRTVAERLGERLRKVDALGRYGGEEFLALLPGAGLATGRRVAERLRKALADEPIVHGDTTVTVTASFGVAELSEVRRERGEATPEALVALADERLYEAKEAGRNRVRP